MTEIELALMGWRLTTAKIIYHMPDCPDLLNWFLWQQFDNSPRFPKLNAFLKWWDANLDGKVHSVVVSVRGLITAADLQYIGSEFRLQ